jgi:outer membrane receptor protein involved in Fe transport
VSVVGAPRARAQQDELVSDRAGASEIEAEEGTGASEPANEEGEAGEKTDESIWGGIEELVVVGVASSIVADLGSADSVIAWSDEDLVALGAKDISDLASFTPNLEIVTAGATTPTFFIRGVGLNDFNPNSTGAVAIYQDDVAINAPAIQLGTLFDMETVNVLRGPQGTGLGRNASAGAIKVYSKKPSGEFGAFMRADFGNYDLQDYEGALEAPIVPDLLAGRLAFRLTQRDGTMHNRCAGAPPFGDRVPAPVGASQTQGPWSICGEAVTPGEISQVPRHLADDVNDTDNWAARATMLFEPSVTMSWLLNVHGSRRDELTRLGQSIGASGNFCVDGEICEAPFFGVPPELRGEASGGLLGGAQGGGKTINTGYQPREIRRAWEKLAPCLVATSFLESCARQPLDERVNANRAKKTVARRLAKRLDSNPWRGDFNRTGKTTNDTWGGYLSGDIELPRETLLKTITAFDRYRRKVDNDLDFSPETLFHINTKDDAWQFYQDVKLEGEVGDESPVIWEVGGWLLREELDVVVDNDFGDTAVSAAGITLRDYEQDTWSAGAYAYLSFDFLEDFTLDGGVRYNYEEKKLDMFIESGEGAGEESFSLKEDWDSPTGTVRLTYRFRDDTHAFWKYTRGWKPGSFNATASIFSGPTVARPEEIDSFEGGLRGSWFDGVVGLDASLFFYSYSDYQIFTAQQFLGGTPEFVILNAEDAEVYGSELEGTLRSPWWEGTFVNVRFAWLESQFIDFVRRDQFLRSGGGGSLVNFRESQNSGNPLLNSPRFKVSMTAEQTVTLGDYGSLTLRYDGVWTDKTYYDATKGSGLGNEDGDAFLPDNTIAQPAYWLHNLRATWRSVEGRLEVAGWVRNIENQEYKQFAFDGSSFQSTTIYFVGDPRTYGMSLMVKFF